VNCFAVPFGNYNEHVKELARNAGYEACLLFTVSRSLLPRRSIRSAVMRLKRTSPKYSRCLEDIGTSTGGAAAVAEWARKISRLNQQMAKQCALRFLSSKPTSGGIGQIEPGSVQMRVSAWRCAASYDPKTGHRVISSDAKAAREIVQRICQCEIRRQESRGALDVRIEEGATEGQHRRRQQQKILWGEHAPRVLAVAPRDRVIESCFHNLATSFRRFSKTSGTWRH